MSANSQGIVPKDLETYYEGFFTNRTNALLALYILANYQMTPDVLHNFFGFRNNQKKNEFITNFPNIDHSSYRLRDTT